MHYQRTLQQAIHASRRAFSDANNSHLDDTPAVSSLKSFRNNSDDGWIVAQQDGQAFANSLDDGSVELLV